MLDITLLRRKLKIGLFANKTILVINNALCSSSSSHSTVTSSVEHFLSVCPLGKDRNAFSELLHAYVCPITVDILLS